MTPARRPTPHSLRRGGVSAIAATSPRAPPNPKTVPPLPREICPCSGRPRPGENGGVERPLERVARGARRRPPGVLVRVAPIDHGRRFGARPGGREAAAVEGGGGVVGARGEADRGASRKARVHRREGRIPRARRGDARGQRAGDDEENGDERRDAKAARVATHVRRANKHAENCAERRAARPTSRARRAGGRGGSPRGVAAEGGGGFFRRG